MRTGLLLLNSASRAGTSTSAAVDAGTSIDYKDSVSLGNGSNRTFGLASSAAYASVVDYVCHDKLLLKNEMQNIDCMGRPIL